MLKCPKCYSDRMRRHSYTESGTQRYSCGDCGFRTVNPIGIEQFDQTIDHKVVAKKLKKVKKKSRWTIVSAQNATPVHQGFLTNLKAYCDLKDAELIVIPYRYKNPTSVFTDKDYEWWDKSIADHLVDKRYELTPGVVLLGDIQIQPTAKTPLTGLEGFTGTASCIVGHPKYQFRTVATGHGDQAKIMTTTGSITMPNYTRSRAGKTGHHHHQFSATIVETDGDCYFIRQITANDDGSFTDLNETFSGGSMYPAIRAASLVLGDLHQWWVNEAVDEATFGEKGIIDTLRPEHVFIHDAMDCFSASHHHRKDPFIMWAKHTFSKASIKQEITDLCDYLLNRLVDDVKYHIVPSNHDDHITRYIKETDWRIDPENAEFYLETAAYMLEHTKICEGGTSTPRPFDYWFNKMLPEVEVLKRDTGYSILGVEHAMHGDQGPNGARGSAMSLSKIGSKATIGHGHSPCTVDGCYQVGVMAPKMTYASGPSGWMSSHVAMYADGKRTHLHIINGKFRR